MSGHAEMRHVKGVDMSTGSLGQGISAAVGMALAGKADGRDYRVYALLGDGEIEEGQVWEAAMAAAKYRLGITSAVAPSICRPFESTIRQRLSSFLWAANIAASQTCPSSISPSPSREYTR